VFTENGLKAMSGIPKRRYLLSFLREKDDNHLRTHKRQ